MARSARWGGIFQRLGSLRPAVIADAGTDFDGKAIDMDRSGDGLDQQLGKTLLALRRQGEGDDDEFVAAEAIDAIGIAERADASGNLDQQDIAALVADEIVDLLEAVEVDGEDGDVAVPFLDLGLVVLDRP